MWLPARWVQIEKSFQKTIFHVRYSSNFAIYRAEQITLDTGPSSGVERVAVLRDNPMRFGHPWPGALSRSREHAAVVSEMWSEGQSGNHGFNRLPRRNCLVKQPPPSPDQIECAKSHRGSWSIRGQSDSAGRWSQRHVSSLPVDTRYSRRTWSSTSGT